MLAATLATFAAGAAEDVGAALATCRSEADDARRLACYDRVAGRIQPDLQPAAPAAAETTPAPAEAAAPAAAETAAAPAAAAVGTTPAGAAQPTEEDFGLERAQAAEEAKRREEKSRAVGELEATVTGIEKRIDGLMTITLDNGQVWRQNTPDSMFRLKQGDRVRIQPGSLKSYILSGPSKRSTRVNRVK
jgi:hypothetical protein